MVRRLNLKWLRNSINIVLFTVGVCFIIPLFFLFGKGDDDLELEALSTSGTFLSGQAFNDMLNSIIPLSEITEISKYTGNCETHDILLSTEDSSLPIYARSGDSMGIVYYCSNADVLYLYSDSRHMFQGLENLVSLDLRGWDSSLVTDMSYMFYGDSNLQTIYVGNTFVTTGAGLSDSDDMFSDDVNLVGGHGTKYDSTHTDKTYAIADSLENSGYFTYDIAVSFRDTGDVELERQIINIGDTLDEPTITRTGCTATWYTDTGYTQEFHFQESLIKYTELYSERDCVALPIVLFTGTTPEDGVLINNSYFTVQMDITGANPEQFMCTISDATSTTEYSTLYDDSLVLMYNFDNVESLGESSTLVKDLSKYGNTGTISSAAGVTVTGGKWGGSYYFSGGKINAGNDVSLRAASNFTVSVRIKTNTNNATANTYFLSRYDSSVNKRVWGLIIPANRNTAGVIFSTNGTNYYNIYGNKVIKNGNWHLITLTHNGSKLSLYVDGELDGSYSVKSLYSTDTQFLIAMSSTFRGKLDEVRMYNRALSTTEIAELYNSNLAKTDTDKWLYTMKFTGLTDGVYTYEGSMADDEGNIADSVSRSINIDLTPPNLTLSSDGNEICSRISPVYTVTGIFSELVTDFDESDLVVVNGSIQNFEELSDTGFIFEVVSDNTGHGAVTVNVPSNSFFDLAGNTNTSNTLSWSYDLVGPTGSIQIDYNGNEISASGTTLNLTLSAEDQGCNGVVEKMQFSCDETNWTPWEDYSTTRILTLEDNTDYGCTTQTGEKTIYIRYKDGFGNVSDNFSDMIIYDTGDPEITLSYGDGESCVGPFVYVTGTFSEDVTGVDMSDIDVINGCISEFRKISGDVAVWAVKPDSIGCDTYVHEAMDGDINTLTICDPNDRKKCVTMMDRNLGATSNDRTNTGSYGYHYQWGNIHGFAPCATLDCPNFPGGESGTGTRQNISGYGPGNWYNKGLFVKNTSSSYGWSTVTTAANNVLWGGSSDAKSNNRGYNKTNNVATNAKNRQGSCPTGYHIPSAGERSQVLFYFSKENILSFNQNSGLYYYTLNGLGIEFAENFNIPFNGYRNYSDYKMKAIGTYSYFWTSSPGGSNIKARGYSVTADSIGISSYNHAYGFSLRCFRDVPLTFPVGEGGITGTVQVSMAENRFTDIAGNSNESGSNIISWDFDVVAPIGSIDVKYNGNDGLATGETVNLVLDAEDPGCSTIIKMQFSCNGTSRSPAEDYVTEKDFNFWDYTTYGCNVVNGEKTIYVRFLDGLGNLSEIYSDTIMLNVSPKVELSSNLTGMCIKGNVYVTGTFNKSVKLIESSDLAVSGGCTQHFRRIGSTKTEWIITNSCDTYAKTMDGINTISVCNPNDKSKCITMMDMNLGAVTNDTSSTGSYGYHYQWGNNYGFASNYTNGSGRFPGGETCNTTKVSTNISVYGPGNWYNVGKFTYGCSLGNNDWAAQHNYNLRGGSGDSIDNNYGYDLQNNTVINATGRQGPCPNGYHVPSIGEWSKLLEYWAAGNQITLSSSNTLKYKSLTGVGNNFFYDFNIPKAGARSNGGCTTDCSIYDIGAIAWFWSSSPYVNSNGTANNTGKSYYAYFTSNKLETYTTYTRKKGQSIRCFKDEPLSPSNEDIGFPSFGTIEVNLPENVFTDLAGNLNESGSNTISWNYDDAGPVGSIDVKYNGNDEVATGEIINLILSAEDQGCNGVVSEMQFSCNGINRSPVENYATTKDFKFLDYSGYGCNLLNGQKTIYVRYIDAFGNIGNVYSDSIILNIPLNVELSSNASGMCIGGGVYITGTFDKVVNALESSDLLVSGGCIEEFYKVGNTTAVWKILKNCHTQTVSGVDTISVCDPNDATKCITMMDKNLGATTNDRTSTGSHGYHYQWGNNHGFASNYTNGSGRFPGGETKLANSRINTSGYGPGNWYNSGVYRYLTAGPYDWSSIRNDNLRGGSGDSQANNRGYDVISNKAINVTGRQGPCPDGYHVPSIGEWAKLLEYWAANYTGDGNDLALYENGGLRYFSGYSAGVNRFVNYFKVPFAGYRAFDGVSIYNLGSTIMAFWSSSPVKNDSKARNIHLYSYLVGVEDTSYRAIAFAVRCFKDTPLSFNLSSFGTIDASLPENVAVDLAGNPNEASNMVSWNYDDAGPVGSIDVKYNGNDELATGETVNLTLSAEDQGCNGVVSGMQFSCNGADRSPTENYETTKNFNFWDYTGYGCNALNGEKTIYVRYIDAFGNIGESTGDSIMLSVSPKVELSSNAGAGYCTNGSRYVFVTGTFSKPISMEDIRLVTTHGCIKYFQKVSDTQVVIGLSDKDCNIWESEDGDIDLLTVCDPNDKSKCITIIDRNLGAVTNDIDSTGSYGNHYQWGNNYGFVNPGRNGSDSITSSATNNYVTRLPTYNHVGYYGTTFIKGSDGSYFDYWSDRTPSNHNGLWGGENDSASNNWGFDILADTVENRQGPCPVGYHVPSQGEWGTLVKYWVANYTGTTSNTIILNGTYPLQYFSNSTGKTQFQIDLKIPFAGYRKDSTAQLMTVRPDSDYTAHFWSSSLNGNSARRFLLNSSNVAANGAGLRAYGLSIRCFKNSHLSFPFSGSTENETGFSYMVEVNLPEGSFRDLAGNLNELGSNTISWNVDEIGPIGTIDVKYNGNDEVATGKTVNLILSAEDQGCNGVISGMQFSCNGIDRSPTEDYATTKDFNFYDYTGYGCSALNGEKTVYVRYIDSFGNVGESSSDSIILHISPRAELSSNVSGMCVSSNEYINISGTFSEPVLLESLTGLTAHGLMKSIYQVSDTGAVWVLAVNGSTIFKLNGLDMGLITVCNPNGTGCITMMDRNLGATKAGTGCSSVDTGACGYHYQRGNNYGFANPGVNNGDDAITQASTGTLALWSPDYNHVGYNGTTFIKGTSSSKYDYWSDKTPSNHNGLRGGSGDNQSNNRGYDEENNIATNVEDRQGPCDKGYHVPSIGEWNQVLEYYAEYNNINLGDDNGLYYNYNTNRLQFQEDFKIPFAGYRGSNAAKVTNVGSDAYLWSSSPNGTYACLFYMNSSNVDARYTYTRANGLSVRCFKDSALGSSFSGGDAIKTGFFGTIEVTLPENSFTDLAGNPNESGSNTISRELDIAGPTGSIDIKYNGNNENASGTTLSLTLSAEDQGCNGLVSGMQFSCNGTNWSPIESYQTTKNFDLLNYTGYGCDTADGEKNIYVRFVDSFGNVGSGYSDSINLDIPPEVSLSVYGDDSCKGPEITVTGEFSENVTGVGIADLTINNGCAMSFWTQGNDSYWIVKAGTDNCDNVYEAMDGIIPTITVCGYDYNTDTDGCITMMDRNLGATSNDIASSGSYGNYYQRGNNFGFSSDPNASITTGDQQIDCSGFGPLHPFTGSTFIISPDWNFYDYCLSRNDNLWGGGNDNNELVYPVDNASERKGPCPDGYHVPSQGEWLALMDMWAGESVEGYLQNVGAFQSAFKIPFAGFRSFGDGSLYNQAYLAFLRSSSPFVGDDGTWFLFMGENETYVDDLLNRGEGYSVRCFKNNPIVPDEFMGLNLTGIVEVRVPENSFTDLVGNENISGSNTLTWEYDAMGPIGSIEIEYDEYEGYTRNTTLYLYLEAEDLGCSNSVFEMEFSCDGRSRSLEEPYSETKDFYLGDYVDYGCNMEDGEKTIYVRYIDAFGNIGDAYSDSIILDTTSPEMELYTDTGNMCRNTLTGQYIITGIFNEVVTGFDELGLLSTGTVTTGFNIISGDTVQWIVEITDDYPIFEKMDGDINTITICDPGLGNFSDPEKIGLKVQSDKKGGGETKGDDESIHCITMMDRNLGATDAGHGCNITDYLCDDSAYLDNNCYYDDEKGSKSIVCDSEDPMTPLRGGLEDEDESSGAVSCDVVAMDKIFNECLKTHTGSYGYHYQWGNNHGFESCYVNGCDTFPGGEISLSGDSDFCELEIGTIDGGSTFRGATKKGGTKNVPQVDASDYGPGNWYSGGVFIYSFADWSNPSNDNLWGGENDSYYNYNLEDIVKSKGGGYAKDGDEIIDIEDRQGPCPEGYHVPTASEWETVFAYRKYGNGEIYGNYDWGDDHVFDFRNYDTYGLGNDFQKAFKIPFAGYRDVCTSEVYGVGRNAYLWSSTPVGDDTFARALHFGYDELIFNGGQIIGAGEKAVNTKSSNNGLPYNGNIYENPRAEGYSVRCFRDTAFDIEELEENYVYTGSNKKSKVRLGDYTYYDLAGNVGGGSNYLYFDYDIEGPIGIIEITYNGNDIYAKGTTLNLSLAAVDPGCSEVDKMQFSCDGVNWSTLEDYSTTKDFSLGDYTNYGCTTGDGEKTIYVKYIDALGNVGTSHYDSIILDTVPPQVEISSDGSGMCSLPSQSYIVTGIFSEPIIGLGKFDLVITGGYSLNFDKISDTGAVWTVMPGIPSDEYIYEMVDGDQATLTICDPSDSTKCITMMDRNLGATKAGTGCNWNDYQCSQGYSNYGYDDYESCYQDCTDYGTPIAVCEQDCTPDLKGYETIDECQDNMEDDFIECINANSGSYGYHYQWGNNHGFAPCLDENQCQTFPGGESMTGDNDYCGFVDEEEAGKGYKGGLEKGGETKDGNETEGGTPIDTSDYGPGNWYSGGNFIYGFEDWSNPSNDNLRGGENDSEENNRGFDTENNVAINATGRQGPCPDGYHVPSVGEWNKVLEYWIEKNKNLLSNEKFIRYYDGLLAVGNCIEGRYTCFDENGNEVDCDSEDVYSIICNKGGEDTTFGLKFQDDFKMPFAGYRDDCGFVREIGQVAGLWSSSPSDVNFEPKGIISNGVKGSNGNGTTAYPVFLDGRSIGFDGASRRSIANSVRCFRDTAMALPQESTGGYGSVTMSIPQNMFTDLAGNGNLSGSGMITWNWDEIGPTGGINIHYNGNTTHASGTILNLVLDADDVGCSEVDKVKFSCDGETWSSFEDYSATKDFSLADYLDVGCTTGDGEKVIYVQYFDALGNTGDVSSGTIILDTVGPQIISLTSDGSGACNISKTYTVTGIFSEVLTGLKSSDLVVTNGVIQDFTKVSGTVAVWKVNSNSGHGEVTVSILSDQIYDLAGNRNLSGSDTIMWNFDELGPTGSIDVKYNGNDIYASGTTLNLILDATDIGCSNIVDKMQFSCDGENRSPLENYSITKNFSLADYSGAGCTIENGEKTIYVRYIDGFGNIGEVYSDGILLDIIHPSVTISSDGNGMCAQSMTYIVTGLFTEVVTGIDVGTLTVTNGVVQNFEQISGNVVKWIVADNTNSTGSLVVNIATGKFTDLAGNTNITGSNMISWDYDNAGPNFAIEDITVSECTTGTMTISGVSQVGCASGHASPYSWDAGNTWVTSLTNSFYSGGQGTKTITVQVRDILGNYTPKTAIISRTDIKPTINDFSVDAVGTGKIINWKVLGNARDGNCGSGNVTATLQTDASIGHCTVDGNNINYVANWGASGNDSCVILVTDDENSTGEFTITWNDIFRPVPEIVFVSPTPVDGVQLTQNRFTTKMSATNIDYIKNFKYQYNNSEYDLMSGLILMYNFDNVEALGESSTLVKDLSNNGNDGTVYGATWTSNGVHGGAYSFDGVDDYIDLPDYDVNDSLKQNGTISVRVKGSKQQSSLIIGTYNSLVIGFYLYNNNFDLTYFVGTSIPYTHSVTAELGNYDNLGWNHLVVTSDNGNIIYYVNGKELVTSNHSDAWNYDSGYTEIGKRVYQDSSSRYFNGQIDEVRVYDRALSQDEVQFLYKSNLRKTSPDTWEFETVNTCLATSGSYNYTGSVVSFFDTSASTGRNLTTKISLLNVNSLGYNFGNYDSIGQVREITGMMNSLSVIDYIGKSGWMVYFTMSPNLIGDVMGETIDTNGLKFKANELNYNGLYEGILNTNVHLGGGISTGEYRTAKGNSGDNIMEYMVRTSDPDDFMCSEVGIYSDNPQIKLEIPAYQIQDLYRGILWITLQDVD